MYCLECLKNIFYVAGKEIDLGGGSMYIQVRCPLCRIRTNFKVGDEVKCIVIDKEYQDRVKYFWPKEFEEETAILKKDREFLEHLVPFIIEAGVRRV